MATLSARYANRSASIGRLLFVCSIMLACRTSEAANLDTTHTVVFSGRPGSHFGYTVELMNNRDGNLALVAAVKDQANSFLGANHTGALYKCRLDPHSCTEVQIQEEGNIREENNDQFSYHALNDYMHLGFSLAVQPGPNGRAIVCAPKWKNQRYYESMYMLNGACYVLSNDLTKLEVLRPFIRKSLQVVQPRINYYSLAEAGFSAHISQNNELILGAPGFNDWTGSLVKYTMPNETDKPLVLTSIANFDFTKVPRIQQYFGYSVTSGKFFDNMGLSMVAGSPRDHEDRKGMVYFISTQADNSLKIQMRKEGEQMGSYFGATLLAIDLNQDGLSDLLVGAPLYSLPETSGDEGKVYIYMSNGASLQLQPTTLMGHSVPGARFGSAIVNIGDLNLDGYPDVAIGAPYEHGHGAVYIYNGGKNGLKATHSQFLEARVLSSPPKGFGISISKAMDVDENYYPDLMVGAYESDQAFLYRAMPLIQARAWIEIETQHLSSRTPNCKRNNVDYYCFPVTPCIFYDGKHVPDEIEFQYNLEMDTKKPDSHRGRFALPQDREVDSIQEIRKVQRGISNCFPQDAIIYGDVKDLLTPFEFRLKYNINKDNERTRRDAFCKECPILDPSSITTVTNKTAFQVACGDDNICTADLILKASISGHEDHSPLVVGKDALVTLNINVVNRADMEPAYLSRVEIHLPENVDIVNLAKCEAKENSTLSCDIGNPVFSGNEATVAIKLGLTKMTKKLEIKVIARTDSVDVDTSNNEVTIALPLIYLGDIGVQGSASISQLVYNKSTNIVPVVHTFTLVKYYDSPINKVAVLVSVPTTILGEREPFLTLQSVVADDGSQSKVGGSCNSSVASLRKRSSSTTPTPRFRREANAQSLLESQFSKAPIKYLRLDCSGAECIRFTCQMGPFTQKNKVATIELHMVMNVTKIMEQVGIPDTVDIGSEGSLTILDDTEFTHLVKEQPKQTTIVTSLIKEGPPSPYRLPWWAYLLIVIGGLLLLMVLILVLYRLGFFRRKAKEELERSKRESLAVSSAPHSPTTLSPSDMANEDPEVRRSLLKPEERE